VVHRPGSDHRVHEDLPQALDRLQGPGRGAIHPRDGFKYAFANGADFACVGMLDFQVRENAIIANKVLSNLDRPRPWRG